MAIVASSTKFSDHDGTAMQLSQAEHALLTVFARYSAALQAIK
jgi:hypothetical protein